MKQLVRILSIAILFGYFSNDLKAQDTTVVQTFTFNDITKRRDVFAFPDDSKTYRRILMRYNLKCDPRTTQDGYDCGEWDYLTYNYVFGHDGKLDSTRKTHPFFRVNNSAPDSFNYNLTPIVNRYREKQYSITHTGTTTVQRYTIAGGTNDESDPFNTAEKVSRAQFIWKASELTASGMPAGNISGLQLDLSTLGSKLQNLEIKLGHTSMDSLTDGFIETGLSQVYRHAHEFTATGLSDIQFVNNFNWNGTDNLVIEFSFSSTSKGSASEVKSRSESFDAGRSVSASNSYLEFRGNQNWANLGRNPVVGGAGTRTIELWAKIDQFNNAGLFQAGTSGTGRDFTLRTTRTVDQFRAQLWGTGFDFNFTSPGAQGTWHHYAMSYDGSVCRVYVDGQMVAQRAVSLTTAMTDFRLGRWQGSYLQGDIDEVRVWNKALSQQTIQDWMGKSVDNTHPEYNNMIGYYPLDEGDGIAVKDHSPNNNPDGYLTGMPWWAQSKPEGLILNQKVLKSRPNIVFEQGVYTSQLDSVYVYDTVQQRPSHLQLFENPAMGVQIPENDPNHPTKITESRLAWPANTYSYTYDKASGNQIGQTWVAADSVIRQGTKVWYSPEYRIEIGRYITPYGIRLDLGPDGFVWWYDVTDYVQYLRDSVDLQAGNQQELIDLQFLFIEGTPAREVLQVNRVWGQSGSYRYRDLDNDAVLSEQTIKKASGAEGFRVMTRFTGHGHNSDDGNYPHCCEWKDNTHYLNVNGSPFESWHIWQTNQCAENPVFPQGGTWNGSREGWCPGDVVTENDFEITAAVTSGDEIKLDYSITPVPTNNQGMGNGNYVIAIHLMQYGKANFNHDVEVYDIIIPSQRGIHGRKGTVCDNPKVVIRNGGSNALTKCEIRYSVDNGDVCKFIWTGNLGFMETEEVELPVSDPGFFTGGGANLLMVKAANPNDKADENTENNEMKVKYDIPVNYPAKVVVSVRTNNFPSENQWEVKDMNGTVVASNSLAGANTQYTDTLDLPDGCYTFYLHDSGNDGLDYWANSAQGSGNARFWIFNEDGSLKTIQPFGADFGRFQRLAFTIGKELGTFSLDNACGEDWEGWEKLVGLKSYDSKMAVAIYPNPAKGEAQVELVGLDGSYEIIVYSMNGTQMSSHTVEMTGGIRTVQLDLNDLTTGMYIVRVKSDRGSQIHRLSVQ